MHKILIICDVYLPSFAPRMGYLMKYMKEFNWIADVVTREQDKDYSFKSLLGDERVFRVKSLKVPLVSKKDKIIRLINQKKHYNQRGKLISNHVLKNLNSTDYELILCSTAHRTYLLDAANTVAKTWNKPWIADIRDLYEQKPQINAIKSSWLEFILDHVNKDFRKFILRKRDFSLQKANSVVTISPWHVEQLKKNSSNVNLIYNGYCPEYFFPRKSKPQNTFKVTYTGLIVSTAYRDPTLLFLAVKKLAENGHIDNRFRIQFYTPKNRRMPLLENPSFEAIKNYVDFFEYVDTSEVPELLADSSILLLLTNKFKDDGPKGIMTTKYFEYLAMERPILCVRSDENLLEMSIKEANAGVAARTIEETYDFLLEKWNEWIEKGRTSVEPNREYTRQFSRKLQAKEFVDIFRKVIDS